MKKVARILVRKVYKRVFNILTDENTDVIDLESKILAIINNENFEFFFEEDYKTSVFIGIDTLDKFPYFDDIENGVHRLKNNTSEEFDLEEVTVEELTTLHMKEHEEK